MGRLGRLAVTTALLGGWSMAFAQANASHDLLPHLVADPPSHIYLDSDNGRLLLRFDGYVHNVGPGPLEVSGQRSSIAEPMVPHQRIYRADGSSYSIVMPHASMIYATADGHHHWHLQSIVAYSLWNRARSRQVAPSMKVGFCLADHEHINPGIGPRNKVYTDDHGRAFCQKYNPDALNVWEGVSAGYRDLYERSLTFQWVDVSDVIPGVYWLREDADPNQIVREVGRARTKPAYATSPTIIPGYIAKSMALPSSAPDRPVTLSLDAKRYGPTGAAQYRILTPPQHGSLDVPTGQLLNHATVVYRPNPGYRGPDSFTYIAKDSESRYPYNPVAATVNLNVGPPIISGAQLSPTSFRLGTRPGLGTTLTFTLSEPAQVRLSFRHCAGGGCTGSVAGEITRGGRLGLNRLRFAGRLSRTRSLPTGTYAVTITAVDTSRRVSRPSTLRFTLRSR